MVATTDVRYLVLAGAVLILLGYIALNAKFTPNRLLYFASFVLI
jgi:hypothetical protein